MNHPLKKRDPISAFSLVEVVVAIGICSFALVAVLGLFTTGLQSNRESEQQIQAANLASMLISLRMASPTNDLPNLPNFAIPTTAMTNAYANAYAGNSLTSYVGLDGQTTSATGASYLISCRAGTNSMTGTGVAQVYLMLSWPPMANPANASAGRYEIIAHIPIR